MAWMKNLQTICKSAEEGSVRQPESSALRPDDPRKAGARQQRKQTHVGRRLGVAGFGQDNLCELVVVPRVHRVELLVVGVDRARVGDALAVVRVQVLLLGLAADVLVVRELALQVGRVGQTTLSALR